MAILTEVETIFGHTMQGYIRLNNLEVNNHGMDAVALFRGFSSKESFEKKGHYIYESSVQFKADVTGNIWEQAYRALIDKEMFTTFENV